MTRSRLLRSFLPALLAAGTTLSAQARGGVAVDFFLALPLLQLEVGVPLPASAVTVQFGGVSYRHYRGQWYRPWGARWVVTVPPVGVVLPPAAADEPPLPAGARSEVPAPSGSRPDPVIEPRRGQGPEQTETDRRECNRLATTDATALADAEAFQRSVQLCMQSRGYSYY